MQAPQSFTAASFAGHPPACPSPSQALTIEPFPPLRVVVLEDDAALRRNCCEVITRIGFTPVPAATLEDACAALRSRATDVLLLDPKVPGTADIESLPAIKEMHPETDLIVMTALPTVSSAVDAMRLGARDYLTKPFAAEQLTDALRRAARRAQFDLQSRLLRTKLRTDKGMGGLIGRSPEMEKVYRLLSKVALSTHPVLICGESGTGKELVARSIHSNGPNPARSFAVLDCSSMVPAIVESKLFGHAGGAFTGAEQSREGMLCTPGCTVFLDEIGELPLDLQARLMRALQEKEVHPADASRPVPLSARVLAASSRDLPAMVAQGQFRRDLYFRLNVVNIRLPPLRERRTDIPVLAEFFLERNEAHTGVPHTFSADAIRAMTRYDWPGNVRELENAIERACALTSGSLLHMADLPTQLHDFTMHAHIAPRSNGAAHKPPKVLSMAEMERQAIIDTIRQVSGDKLTAARLLGIGKTTLYRKLKEYSIPASELESR